MAHNNAELVRNLYDAFRSGDMPTIERLLADSVTWHAPGRGQNAGIRRGKAELYAAMGKLAELTGGTLGAEIHDVLANEHHAVIIQTTRGNRQGFVPLEDREVTVFRIADGKVAEVWEHPGDLYAMDAFFS